MNGSDGRISGREHVSAPDIVGFGALNVDVIASASGLSERASERITESTARFEWNREDAVDRDSILQAIQHLGSSSLNFSLGGSAWLTMYALAQMRLGLRLGYVGALGRIEAPGVSFRAQMAEMGIDDMWVGSYLAENCGVCLSFIDDDGRVMHTNPGANLRIADHVNGNFENIAQYLASARFVHVTSFLDSDSPAAVLAVLTRAKQINADLKIGVDPGFDWADHPSPAISGILGLADLLFANFREFKALGRPLPGESDDSVARKVLDKHNPHGSLFVTKRYDYVEVFHGNGDAPPSSFLFQLSRPLQGTDIEDATGAGDVFAAAVLGALAADSLHVELGAYLGLAMARSKMQAMPGADADLPDVSRGFLQVDESVRKNKVQPRRVFVLHDANSQVSAVVRFLENRCGLETDCSNLADAERSTALGALAERLDQCGFGICLIGADHRLLGRRRPQQRLVHTMGVLHGRYGFGRVAMLIEQGCDVLSNLSGLIRLEFPPGNVEAVLVDLQRMLSRELQAPGASEIRQWSS